MLQTLMELCALSGISGFEEDVRTDIVARVRPYADEMRVDAMGNLIVFKKGAKSAPNHLMLCAHMDEVGFMVSEITEQGYLKFEAVGGIDRKICIGKTVLVGAQKIPGVIGIKAIHLTTAEERKITPKMKELYIDIGAKDKKDAETVTFIGDYVVFDSTQTLFGDKMLLSKAIDDRIGCAVMVELLKRDLPVDCTFAFTVQEEVGTRGAFGAAFSVQPKNAIILEGTTAADSPSQPEHKQVCYPGRGPVVPFMDGGSIYSPELYALTTKTAQEQGIPWQTKHYVSGGTDGRTIQRSRTGARVIGISAAVRYLHAPSSVVSITDYENMIQLADAVITALAEEV